MTRVVVVSAGLRAQVPTLTVYASQRAVVADMSEWSEM